MALKSAILAFCLAATLVALFNGQTSISTKYPSITPGVSVFLFFFFMAIVGMLEGMQVRTPTWFLFERLI